MKIKFSKNSQYGKLFNNKWTKNNRKPHRYGKTYSYSNGGWKLTVEANRMMDDKYDSLNSTECILRNSKKRFHIVEEHLPDKSARGGVLTGLFRLYKYINGAKALKAEEDIWIDCKETKIQEVGYKTKELELVKNLEWEEQAGIYKTTDGLNEYEIESDFEGSIPINVSIFSDRRSEYSGTWYEFTKNEDRLYKEYNIKNIEKKKKTFIDKILKRSATGKSYWIENQNSSELYKELENLYERIKKLKGNAKYKKVYNFYLKRSK